MKNKTRYTFEACKDEALKYEYLKDFIKKSNRYYKASLKYGYADITNKHLKRVGNAYKRCIYACVFNDKHIYIGLTFDLQKRSYNRAKDHDDAVTIHARETGKKYSVVQLTDYIDKDIARKCEHSFLKRYADMGWSILNRCKVGGLGGSIVKWDDETIHKAASKCSNRIEFIRRYSGAANRAKANGTYRDICHKYFSDKWDFNNAKKEALKYNTRTEFKLGSGGAYSWAQRSNVLDEICAHMIKGTIDWTLDSARGESLKFTTRGEFYNYSSKAYSWAYSHGVLDDICSHMVDGSIKWTPNKIKEEALKYNIRKEFQKGSAGAHKAAIRCGILDEVCSHMTKLRKSWSYESVIEAASQCETLDEFTNRFSGALKWARRNKRMDEIHPYIGKTTIKSNI